MSVRIEKKDRVATVILDRSASRNAIDRFTADALAEAFCVFDADGSCDVAVLWGAGGHFCAGADLKAMASGNGINRVAEGGDGPLGPTRLKLSKPVIAAVAGYAVAGGMELACWCDLRVIEESATFGVFCRRWGVPLIDGGTVRLPRLIGQSRALDLILTGRPVRAAEALAIGLANRVVPDGSARAAAEQLAQEIARFPQRCLRNDRRSAYEQWDQDFDAAMRNETCRGIDTLASGEALRGANQFSGGEGRSGSFRN